MVSKLAGEKGMSLLTSLMVSVVIGLEFSIASTLTSNICNDLLSKLFPCVLTKAFRIPLAVLICLSQIPPMWLAIGGSNLCRASANNRLFYCGSCLGRISLTAPMKLLPLSELICRMFPLLPINLHNVSKKESVSTELVTSIWIAWLQRHVNMTP